MMEQTQKPLSEEAFERYKLKQLRKQQEEPQKEFRITPKKEALEKRKLEKQAKKYIPLSSS